MYTKKKLLAALLVSALAAGMLPTSACAASADYTTANATLITLTDSAATAKGKYTGYEIDGTVTDRFPTTPELMRARPVFTTLPGWKCDIRGCTDNQALPQQAKAYVDFLESRIGYPITLVSTGPKRNEITVRQK